MSLFAQGGPRIQEVIDAVRGPIPKCRIPQRLIEERQKQSAVRSKQANNLEAESHPKSANRGKDESPISGRLMNTAVPRLNRPEREKLQPSPRRPSTIPKRLTKEAVSTQNKSGRSVITVPITQRPTIKIPPIRASGLPTQDKIMKSEELELHQCVMSGANQTLNDLNNRESITSSRDNGAQLKIGWKEMLMEFEKMNTDLKFRQKTIIELYAKMCSIHQKMTLMGKKVTLPSAQDLHIMNVAKMTPEQLLQLCAGGDPRSHDEGKRYDNQLEVPLSIDINKLYSMPTKLVETCQYTLVKRKEIIDWLDSLQSVEKGISTRVLSKKIQEFNAENDMLQCALDDVKGKFLKEHKETIENLRQGVNETMALQLQTEQLTCKLSELNSHNVDLRKQIHNASQHKSHTNKFRIEELEKELKEEKCKKEVIKDRLTRAEGKIKIGIDRASQLEAALEQARSQTWTLERTIQQLHEQNKKIQCDYDKELNDLTESIKLNTSHLEEIADAREKLQAEKEDLEKRLNDLSKHYNESLQNIKQEMSNNEYKLIESEKKQAEDLEVIKKLEIKTETLCVQLLESELRYKDLLKQFQAKESELSKAIDCQTHLDTTKAELEEFRSENEDCRNQLKKQNKLIQEIETKLKDTINLENSLKSDLSNKDEYIIELEKQQSLLEQQLQESESKMLSYEEQLFSLKKQIKQLQDDFGEYENVDCLHEKIKKQQNKLTDITKQKMELAEALQKTEIELDRYVQNLLKQEQALEQKECDLKILYEKQQEQSEIMKLFRNNLEIRLHAEMELGKQLAEKNLEIKSLVANVETRKQTISQLEKIILTLEEQIRKNSSERMINKDIVTKFEKELVDFEPNRMENKYSIELPSDNFDNLIKLLENELESSFESPPNVKKNRLNGHYKKEIGAQKREKRTKLEDHHLNSGLSIQAGHDSMPTKVVIGDYEKKTYMPSTGKLIKDDIQERKNLLKNIETKKTRTEPDFGINYYSTSTTAIDSCTELKGPTILPDAINKRNLLLLNSQKLRNDKKCKMFKFASHRL